MNRKNKSIINPAFLTAALLVLTAAFAAACSDDPMKKALNDKPWPLLPPAAAPSGGSGCTGPAIWTEVAGNPIIHGGGTSGTDRAYYPFVLYAGGTYHIWYGDGTNTRHATSTRPDFSDATFPADVVTGLAPTFSPYHPRVLYRAGGWTIGGTSYPGPFLMYYTNGADWNVQPHVAHSADGQAWTDIGACTGINNYGGNTTVYNLAVLYEGGTSWKGYADNGLGIIQYYTSANGLDWTGQALDVVGAPYQAWEDAGWRTIAPFIMKYGSTYILFYSAGVGSNDGAFGYATSADGSTFTKSTSNPIFSISDGVAWRDIRTYTTSIVTDGTTWYLYFTGRTNTPSTSYSVGLARKCGGPM